MSRTSSRPRLLADILERRTLLDGLSGQYFNRMDFTEPVLTRLDPTIDFTWSGSPAAGVRADFFSVRWTGQMEAQKSEVYTFHTTADDGVRLWVDGRLLIDNWINQGATDRSGTVALEAGKRYDIRVDYYEYNLGSRIGLFWSSATTPKQIIPAAALFAPPAGLTTTIFENTDFTRPVLSRTDGNVNFAWPTGTPASGVDADGFAVRWSGQITPQFSQTYRFFATPSDAAATVRLRVDGKLLVDSSSVADDGRITLEAGKRYSVLLDYADPSGSAGITLEWSSPSVARQIIPADRFLTATSTSIPTSRTLYFNPIIDLDRPDPGVIVADGAYWMIHTSGGPGSGWPLWRSTDQVTWTFQKELLTSANKQSWMNGEYWAPEIHKVGGNFVLTGTSRDSRTGRLTIAMASSPTINGNYTVRSEPILSDSRHVLDSNIFIDDDGTPYLLWKRDGPSGGQFGSIRIRKLDATALNFAAGSSETVILDNETAGWERNLAEAPWLVRRADAYYLFYSAAFIDTTYSVGVARNTSLTSMFTRNSANPILTNNTVWGGPGHGGFALDLDGTLYHQYHARLLANPDAGRKQLLDPVVWNASGWPSFGNNGTPSQINNGPRVAAATESTALTFNGDATVAGNADTFRLVRSSTNAANLDIYVNNVLLKTTDFAQVLKLTFDGKAGDDSLVLDYSRGDVIPGGGIVFTGGSGTLDSIAVTGTDSDDVFQLLGGIGGGVFASGSGVLSMTGIEQFNLGLGTYRLVGDVVAGTINATGSTLNVEATQHLLNLNLLDDSRATITNANLALVTTALTLSNTATLDLGDAALIVNYGSVSPLADIEAAIRNARGANATWTHPGITSSSAIADATHARVVGITESSAAFGAFPATFATQSIDSTAILVRSTLAGDVSLNRTVTFDDLLRLAQNYGQSGQSYYQGNVDYSADGVVGFDDLLLLAQQYGASFLSSSAIAARTESKRRAATDVIA